MKKPQRRFGLSVPTGSAVKVCSISARREIPVNDRDLWAVLTLNHNWLRA